GEWFHPGIGGGIHNAPNSLHAMRSGPAPFFAIWCLLV
ncbi:MAG TPA: dimethylsulfonioproprionate lyase family protein, partial [Noviherbaspirillum sp.]|nr:dimethylsulfonioproprionate lyase family protein [Noviherbaspirillum sp.]